MTRVSGRGLEAAAWRGPWRFCVNKFTSVERVACAPLSMTESGERAEFISRSTKRRVSCGNKGILPQLRPHTEHTHRRQRTDAHTPEDIDGVFASEGSRSNLPHHTPHPAGSCLLASARRPRSMPLRPVSAVPPMRSHFLTHITHVAVQQHQQTESLLLAPPACHMMMNVPRPSTFTHGQHEAQARGCRATP